MTTSRYFKYDTVDECKAFIEGVEYANDSEALEVKGAFVVPVIVEPNFQFDEDYYVWVINKDEFIEPDGEKPKDWDKRQKIQL